MNFQNDNNLSFIEEGIYNSLIYFKLSRWLTKKRLVGVSLVIVLASLLLGLGYLAADIGHEKNFVCMGFDFENFSTDIFDSPDILANFYVLATIFFFIINLYILPYLLKKGLLILFEISDIYSDHEQNELLRSIHQTFLESRFKYVFSLVTGLIFLIGELMVIYKFKDHWTIFYIIFLLIIPILLNSIMVGTQIFIISSILRIVRKLLPPLPTSLYDADGVGGLKKAGEYIYAISFIWFLCMGFISMLFIMSGNAGLVMFFFLALLGFSVLFVPQFSFHKLLKNRQHELMREYADELNKILEEYKISPHENTAKRLEIMKENYKHAKQLKVWLFFSMPSFILQIVTFFWPIVMDKLKAEIISP